MAQPPPAVVSLGTQPEAAVPHSRDCIVYCLTAPKTQLSDVDGNLVLFLKKNERQQWETEGWGSGVKWLVEEKVFGYQQLMNPSDYFLLPDREVKTEAELRKKIQKAVAKKSRYTTAKSIADSHERVKALAEFVQPEEKSFFYFRAALDELTKAGPDAGSFLRLQAERPEQKPHRRDFLVAFGHSLRLGCCL